MKALLTALASGVLLYLSQGLDDRWWLAWFAPVPLLWLAYGNGPGWQLMLAAATAWFAGQYYVVQCYGAASPLLVISGILPPMILFVLAVSFARFARRRAPPWALWLAFPAAWTAGEFLFGLVSPNGSYGSLAYSQMSAPFLIQSASLFGMYSVTFVLCLFANTLAMALHRPLRSPRFISLGLGLCALNVAFGLVRLSRPQAPAVAVGAFVAEDIKYAAYRADTEAAAVGVADAYVGAIRGAAAQGVKFAVMPEGGLVTRGQWQEAVLAPLQALAQQAGIQIIAGIYDRAPSADLAIDLQPGQVPRSYAKRHLVPFLDAEFTPGGTAGGLGDDRGMVICKDMDFPRTIRSDARAGIRLMGVPAGDFGKDAWLHARMAIMRGVENGFALVRSANDGLLTASDAEGRLAASLRSTPHGMALMVADLPLGPGPTLYTRIGDVFGWFMVVVLLGMGGACARGARSAR